jgi:hypothetical protein
MNAFSPPCHARSLANNPVSFAAGAAATASVAVGVPGIQPTGAPVPESGPLDGLAGLAEALTTCESALSIAQRLPQMLLYRWGLRTGRWLQPAGLHHKICPGPCNRPHSMVDVRQSPRVTSSHPDSRMPPQSQGHPSRGTVHRRARRDGAPSAAGVRIWRFLPFGQPPHPARPGAANALRCTAPLSGCKRRDHAWRQHRRRGRGWGAEIRCRRGALTVGVCHVGCGRRVDARAVNRRLAPVHGAQGGGHKHGNSEARAGPHCWAGGPSGKGVPAAALGGAICAPLRSFNSLPLGPPSYPSTQTSSRALLRGTGRPAASLQLLWTWSCPLTEGMAVSGLAWNRANPDLLAAGYSSPDEAAPAQAPTAPDASAVSAMGGTKSAARKASPEAEAQGSSAGVGGPSKAAAAVAAAQPVARRPRGLVALWSVRNGAFPRLVFEPRSGGGALTIKWHAPAALANAPGRAALQGGPASWSATQPCHHAPFGPTRP